jgi:hypothetical protein
VSDEFVFRTFPLSGRKPRAPKGASVLAARYAFANGVTIAAASREFCVSRGATSMSYRALYPDAPKKIGRPRKAAP